MENFKSSFLCELQWRGLLYDVIPGTDEWLSSAPRAGYIGFDPTAISLGIGNLVQIIILTHFQRHGHLPIALLGGATGMVGDPSGKSDERNLIDTDQLQKNINGFKTQMNHFLHFESGSKVTFVNNHDWYQPMGVLEFLRDVGKFITVNYMLSKDSVKNRMDKGISYTEFSYQLLQGYDFYRLSQDHDCFLQMGGSDQWGNLTTGVEFIRRLSGKEAFAATTPLVTKADGTKFGKSEKGNVFLSPELTSPYSFYQFWLNVSDEDAERFIKIFI